MDEILNTKLYRPRVSANLIARNRLIDKLERNIDKPLAMISAPTGYGKSMVVAQWTAQSKQSSTWLSLDENDNHFTSFLNYFQAAITKINPNAFPNSCTLLQKSTVPDINDYCKILLNEISQLKKSFSVILDDYHLINNKQIHNLITELLRHPSRKMHLVLISRTSTSLPLIHYLSKNQMNYVSIEDLRFTIDETRELLAKSIPERYDDKVIELLVKKMDGWVTGIALTLLSLFENQRLTSDDIENNTAHYLQEYLTTEISKNIEPQTAQYLLECSVLDKFCAPLVQQISSKTISTDSEQKLSAATFMQNLDKSHLFVNCLDCENRWCSLHPLFRDFLQNKMADEWSDEDLVTLHNSATKWLKENGYIKEAIKHAYLSGDIDKALVIFQENNGLNGSKWTEVEEWLATIPKAVKRKHPITFPSVKLTFKTSSGAYAELSKRESEVLPYVAQGLSNKEIASALYLSPETIKKHLYRIFQKLDTRSRTETILKATQLGLLPQVGSKFFIYNTPVFINGT